MKDNTIAEIKSRADEAWESSDLRQKIADQMSRYHDYGVQKFQNGNVQLWIKATNNPGLKADLLKDFTRMLGFGEDTSKLSWLDIRFF